MKKILIRSGMLPFNNYIADEVLIKNLIWANTGNMLFPYSIMRALMVDENVEFVYGKVSEFAKKINIDEINEKYDYYIVPLANNFRQSYSLKNTTKFIQTLKIPCIVCGVGLQAPFEPNLKEGFPFDNDVKEFCYAVLEKSSSIGVRGEITYEYLKRLGIPTENISIIGCPSMQMFGATLPFEKRNWICEPKIATNIKPQNVGKNILQFMTKIWNEYKNSIFIPQEVEEGKLVYAGYSPKNEYDGLYPYSYSHPLYKYDRVRFFVNVPSWINFLKNYDLSIGNRLHGTIAAILAGIPAILISRDSRTRELADYHKIPIINEKEINEKTTINELYSKADFSAIHKAHPEKFRIFIEFLNKNGIKHIYNKTDENSKISCPFDIKISKTIFSGHLHTLSNISSEEVEIRVNQFYKHYQKIINTKKTASQTKKIPPPPRARMIL